MTDLPPKSDSWFDPNQAARLLEAALRPDPSWDEDDYPAIFSHLLESDLDIPEISPPAPLVQQFLSPQTSVQHLRAIKDFARATSAGPTPLLPHALSAALYHLAVAAALAHHRTRITSLDPDALAQGLNWLQSREWIPDSLKAIACRASAHSAENSPIG